MSQGKRILLVTTANLATNPRLLKEWLALRKGHEVEILAFRFENWSAPLEEKLRKQYAIEKITYLSGDRSQFWPWLMSSLAQKVGKYANRLFPKSVFWSAMTSSKRTWLLHRYLQKRSADFDLVIGHNLGAFYPVYRFASKRGIKYGLDIEDYHPGETIAVDAAAEKKRRIQLMKSCIQPAAYATYASPLILDATQKEIGQFENQSVINNVFLQAEFKAPATIDGPLKLVWFSQNISEGRGLEEMVEAIAATQLPIELHLIGNKDEHFYQQFLKQYAFVRLHAPMSQAQLHQKLGDFDVGLALEINKTDFNRQICLTNKIFAYFQAGLYLLATNTPAQKLFMQEHQKHGVLIKQDQTSMQDQLSQLVKQLEPLRTKKNERYEAAKQLSWEKEQQQFLAIIERQWKA